MSRQLAILLIACFIFSVRARTQVYPFVRYTPRDGLVGNKVRCINQDSKGKLYFGTTSGLSVYDGSRFTNYSTENGLYHNLINHIEEAGNDSVLVILNADRLQYIRNGKIGNVFLRDSLCPVINQWVRCRNGNEYAIADEGLFRFEKDHFSKVVLSNLPGNGSEKNLDHATELDSFLVINMEVINPAYRAPKFFIAYNYYTGKIFTDTRLPDVYFSAKTPQNELMLATAKGIFILDQMALSRGEFRLSSSKFYSVPPNTIVDRLYFDHQENLWTSTTAGVLKIAPGGAGSFFSEENGLPANYTSNFFQDREGIMWFGNDETGVVKLVSQDLQFYKQLERAFTVYDVCVPAGSDSVWMYDQVHHRLLLDHEKQITQYEGLRKKVLFRIAMGKKRFYGSGSSSIYQLYPASNGSFTMSTLYSNPGGDEAFSCLVTDPEENVIGLGNSIVAVLDGNKVVQEPLDYFADKAVLTKDNFLIVVTRSMNFYIYKIDPSNHDKYLQLHKRINWKDQNIEPRSIDVDASGNLWMGTRRNGLVCYTLTNGEPKLSRHLTVKNGLTENFIKYVYCDAAANRIWACTSTGLDRISFKDKNIVIENVTKASNMYLDMWKVTIDHAGVVWGVASSGLVKVHPFNETRSQFTPEIILSKFTVNNEIVAFQQKEISLKSFQNNLSFHVAVPSFFDEKKTLFSYRLDAEGEEGTWTESASQPDISFLNLSPGRYDLKVRSVFLNGKYLPLEAGYSFIIRPPWWQTGWFRLMGAMFVFLVVFVFFRQYYRGQLQKQLITLEKKQLIEKERSRIATDMHDDMGAGLSRIKVLSETIKFENQKGIVNPVHLQKISSYSEEMMDKMGEIVWALNQQNDSIDDLLAYTRAYAVDYLTSHGINCVFHAPAEHSEIFVSGEMRRNIFLSVKEVLHNVVKHAEATQVDITINLGKQLFILIHDNGKGIDPGKTRKFGNGINNIMKRMADIGGTASFKNEKGTLVSLQLTLD